VDLKKCFDSINRNALWFKLYNAGVEGKLLRLLRDMYSKVKSCVKQCNSYSDYFEFAVGLRQGEVLSPILVSLFLDDLEQALTNNSNTGLVIDDIVLIALLFADDMCIVDESIENLQTSLDQLYNYCNTWGLEVNTEKTKVMVFRKRGTVFLNETWTYNGNIVEVVDDFNYLGCIFNYTGSFLKNQEFVIGKSLKALNALLYHCKKIRLKPKLLCQLFDSFVGSILAYSSEIWGFGKFCQVERIHLKFCKRLLGVRQNVNSNSVYGELARYPLYISRYVRIIRYWCKLLQSNNSLIKVLYMQGHNDCENGCKNWVYNVKTLLNSYGFGYMFYDAEVIGVRGFPELFKQRVIESFIQQWHVAIENSPILDTYKHFKSNFDYEEYLDILPFSARCALSKIRLSSHSLRIQTGRFGQNRLARHERLCLCCNSGDIEDEYHFICICKMFDNLRKRYLKRCFYARPSVFKFIELMKSSNKTILRNLCIFIKEALSVRQTLFINQ
jgi:hypothetical protein